MAIPYPNSYGYGRRPYSSRYPRDFRGSRYGRRWFRRGTSMKSRAYGNLRAAYNQRDGTEVVINRVTQLTVTITSGASIGAAGLQMFEELAKSSFYNNYAPMYDQMKLVGVRVRINGAAQGTNTSSYLTPTVTTAWDRNGFEAGTSLTQLTTNVNSYSSAVTKPWSLGNAFIQDRSIWAETLQEKGSYVSPSNVTYPPVGELAPSNWYQNPAVPWKPIFLVQVALPSPAGQIQQLGFSVEMDIIVRFRGLRKGFNTVPTGNGTDGLPTVVDRATVGSAVRLFSQFTAGTGAQISIPNGSSYVAYVANSGSYSYYYIANNTGAAITRTVPVGTLYTTIDAIANVVAFSNGGSAIFSLADTNQTDVNNGYVTIPAALVVPSVLPQ